jgi:hypothetical protein
VGIEVVNLGALDLLRRLLLLLLLVVIDDCGGLGGRFEVGSGGSSFLAFLCYTVAYISSSLRINVFENKREREGEREREFS